MPLRFRRPHARPFARGGVVLHRRLCRDRGRMPLQSLATDPAAVDVAAATKETEDWRASTRTSYRREWATIAGLHFLEPGSHTAGTATTNDIVLPASAVVPSHRPVRAHWQRRALRAGTGSRVVIGAEPVTRPIDLTDDAAAEPDRLEVGDIRMVVHRSGDRKSLRVWDPVGEMARGFLGFRWFDIQMDYRVTGRLIPDASPRDLQVMNTLAISTPTRPRASSSSRCTGRPCGCGRSRLAPNGSTSCFKDDRRRETYEAARFLYADLRDDGTTVLDFNQAYNPPCAFNPYTTCPIPLSENRLEMKVLAGEHAYPVHVTLPKS